MINNYNAGFTLNEGLIAVAIIGIVAALTVPVVAGKYQQKTMVTKLEKNYVELQENLSLMSMEQYRSGVYNSLLSTAKEATAERFFREYYNVTKHCQDTAQPCFSGTYRSITSSDEESFSCADGYSVLLKNGVAICIQQPDATEKTPVKIYMDVNGSEKPNIGGRDMFVFYVYEDFSIDDDLSVKDAEGNEIENLKDKRETNFNSNCKTSPFGVGCFGKIMNDNWIMTY